MRPPANRNFVPEDAKAAAPRTPAFYHVQPTFSIPPASMRKTTPDVISQMGCIPQPQTKNISLPLREVNDLRRVYRGNGVPFSKSVAKAVPLNTLKGVGADLASRTNHGNFDPKQRGLAVTSD